MRSLKEFFEDIKYKIPTAYKKCNGEVSYNDFETVRTEYREKARDAMVDSFSGK